MPAATPADALIANLVTAYQDLEIIEHDDRFAEDFTFTFSLVDRDLAGTADGTWNQDSDPAATRSLLGGGSGIRRDGISIPPVVAVDLSVFPLGDWTDVVERDHPGKLLFWQDIGYVANSTLLPTDVTNWDAIKAARLDS